MATATVALPGGAKVTIEGTDEEVVGLLARLQGLGPRSSDGGKSAARATKARPSLPDLISEMIDGGFFKEPKPLATVKNSLEQNGQFYPVTTLSPALLRLVRAKQLRRIKDSGGRWSYVG